MSDRSELIRQRLNSLRQLMEQHHLDAYIVNNSDAHNSEYAAAHWLARSWVSGFTGSAGIVVVLSDKYAASGGGGLWTDGRYFIQAEEQLAGTGLELFKTRIPGEISVEDWLVNVLPEQARVGVDGRTLTMQQQAQYQSRLDAKDIILCLDDDLVGDIWLDRPARASSQAWVHDQQFAGRSVEEKLSELREHMQKQGLDTCLLCSLDDIAWLFNIRGGDIKFFPVIESFARVSREEAVWYVQSDKLNSEVLAHLKQSAVITREYEDVSADLATLEQGTRLYLSMGSTNASLGASITEGVQVKTGRPLTQRVKATKNPQELLSIQECLRWDGVAMVRFAKWLEESVPQGCVTECSAAEQLRGFRQALPGFIDNSFNTIAGFAANGAKMHYAAEPETSLTIEPRSFFLVDSGGQYPGGTTDITRTYHFGELNEQEKLDYTLVLQAMIRLSMARFRKGVSGVNIDVIARGVMWQHGIDYGCGTGHGVGVCLSVHEGPQNISPRLIDAPLDIGMLLTNEPGVYRQSVHGVRIENIMQVVASEKNEFGEFYAFDTLTLAPIMTTPILRDRLSESEIAWLNDYHQRVYAQLAPELSDAEQAWLNKATQAI